MGAYVCFVNKKTLRMKLSIIISTQVIDITKEKNIRETNFD
jgi:hypothetical protein